MNDQARYDQAERLRNEIRPTKSYQLKEVRDIENYKLTTRIAPIHDHDVKFSFIGFKLTDEQFKKTGAWVTKLETELRAKHQPNNAFLQTALNELNQREQNEGEASENE